MDYEGPEDEQDEKLKVATMSSHISLLLAFETSRPLIGTLRSTLRAYVKLGRPFLQTGLLHL